MIQSVVGHGVISPKLDGKYTPATALDQLLAHTGLHYEYLDAKTVVVLGPHAETKSTGRRIIALDSGVVQLPGPATEGRMEGSGLASTGPGGDRPAILVNRPYQPRY